MPTDEVTDADREAANAWWYGKSTAGVDPNEDLAIYLAGYRTASEQRGYDRAIAEVVAMLDTYIRENVGAEGTFHARWIKDAIEAGEHKP